MWGASNQCVVEFDLSIKQRPGAFVQTPQAFEFKFFFIAFQDPRNVAIGHRNGLNKARALERRVGRVRFFSDYLLHETVVLSSQMTPRSARDTSTSTSTCDARF